MWHEARRQERKIRGMLVDYRKRAERRRDFYEKIKADPTQFLQIHGRQCKIHLDQNIAAAADNAVMMPWQGQSDNLIDRFDVRAHLDYIPILSKDEEEKLTQEERHLNYERYRIIAQNSFLGLPEEKFLKQLHLEEQFGYTEIKYKKEARTGGAAIGFNYEDNTGVPNETFEESDEDNSDSDLDVDLAINVSKMDSAQANEMNKHGRSYGMSSNDFYSFLINDLEEAEAVRLAREEEQEKALFSGRKSRRERRYHREKRLANRTISPPSYAAKASPTLLNFRESKSKSRSRSPSPDNSGKITYITSFGEDEETPSSSKATFANKVKFGKPKVKTTEPTEDSTNKQRSRTRSKDRYYNKGITRFNRNKSRRSTSASRSRSRSRSYKRRRSASSSPSKSSSSSRSRKSNSNSREKIKNLRKHHSSSSSSSSDTSTTSSSSGSLKNSAKNTLSRENSSEPPTKAIPRYYGRNRNDKSSSELSDEEDTYKPGESADNQGNYSHVGTSSKKQSVNLTIAERLKRKRQALLNRQFKADKIAEQIKTERERLEQQTREDELREMAIKLRKRQREKRHANDSLSSSDSDSSKSDESVKKEKSRSRSQEKERDDSRKPETRKFDYKREDREKIERKDNSDRRRRSSSRDRKRERRDRDDRDRRRWTPSPSRGSRDRGRDDRDKGKHTRLVNY